MTSIKFKIQIGGNEKIQCDYMVELKQNDPALLDNLLSDYEISSSIHPAEHISDKHLVSCISLEAH